MTTNRRIRRASSPAYYLARPAALWLAAFTPSSAAAAAALPQSASKPRPEDRASCVAEARGPASDMA